MHSQRLTGEAGKGQQCETRQNVARGQRAATSDVELTHQRRVAACESAEPIRSTKSKERVSPDLELGRQAAESPRCGDSVQLDELRASYL